MESNPKQSEIEVLQKGSKFLSDNLISEFEDQGHHLTGGWENSLRYSILSTGAETISTGTANFYGGIVNAGTSPDRIPYGGQPTGAKTSKYIQGLKSFWMLRGLEENEALKAAFATAKKQRSEGMPTIGSYQFSNTGQRRDFVLTAGGKVDVQLDDIIGEGLDEIIDNLFHETKSETK